MQLQHRRRWFGVLAVLTSIGLANPAQAQTPAPQGGTMGGRTGSSPEEMARHLERRIDDMVKIIGGTPDQKDKLVKLAQAAMADMKPLREQHMAARKKGLELLAAPQIDRAALEQLRTQQMQMADAMSRRMVQQMADAAEVLTPAQRAQLAARMQQRGQHMGRPGHRGGSGGSMENSFFGGWGR